MANSTDPVKNLEAGASATANLVKAVKEFRAAALLFMLLAPILGKGPEADKLGDELKAANAQLSEAIKAAGGED